MQTQRQKISAFSFISQYTDAETVVLLRSGYVVSFEGIVFSFQALVHPEETLPSANTRWSHNTPQQHPKLPFGLHDHLLIVGYTPLRCHTLPGRERLRASRFPTTRKSCRQNGFRGRRHYWRPLDRWSRRARAAQDSEGSLFLFHVCLLWLSEHTPEVQARNVSSAAPARARISCAAFAPAVALAGRGRNVAALLRALVTLSLLFVVLAPLREDFLGRTPHTFPITDE
jgi:hypothetical protein